MNDLLAWLKDRKDPLSTLFGVCLGLSVIAGKSPVEVLNWFLLMPTAQYVRLLSGIVLILCFYFLFRKDCQ